MKIFITRISLLVLILMIALSCTKIGKNITVKGRVLNPITGVGISGVEIKLLRSQNLQYNGGYKAIKKVVSDENGNYEINATRLGPIYLIPGEIGQNYSLGFNYEGNYYSMKKVDKGKVMHIDYHLVPYGEYRIKINNINCQGTNDTLIINQTNQTNSFLGVDWVLTGCDGYTTSWDKVPMGTIHTKYTVIRNGISNSFVEDFKVLPNQQNEQIINY